MKKTLLTLPIIALAFMLAPTASADTINSNDYDYGEISEVEAQEVIERDFSYGQTEDGYYCHSETCDVVYEYKTASNIGDYENRASLQPSAWYMRKEIEKKQSQRRLSTDTTWNRIRAMIILRAK